MSSKMRCVERAKLARTTRLAESETSCFVFEYLRSFDCPRSLTVWLLFVNNEHSQLVDLECDPAWYESFHRFRDAYQSTFFLQKADFLSTGIDKAAKAKQKFLEFEALCRATNDRFRDLSSDDSYSHQNVPLLSAMIRKIDQILTPFTADEFVDSANWGPGVTTRIRGSGTSAFNKFRDEHGITRDLYRLVSPWFSMAYPSWKLDATGVSPLDSLVSFEVGNRVVTVPKNSKTDRVIAIEPGLNIWFQKSIGTMIRRRLLKVGIDLNTQERNQRLAQASSFDDSLATVDFSSASDSISKHLVRAIIRDSRWLTVLESTRSRYGSIDGKTFKWNKFSSMGNGFTFELESLIFYAAAFVCCEMIGEDTATIAVFGDDVVLPSRCYDLFHKFCTFLGFRINQAKSFSSGPFRESCGSHYYEGKDCKPIFLKGRVTSVISLYKLANNVRNLAHRRNFGHGCDARFLRCWKFIRGRIPKPLRLCVSRQLGDVGLHTNFDEACPALSRNSEVRRAGRGFEGYRITGLVQQGISLDGDGQAILLARLWGMPLIGSRRSILRDLINPSDLAYGNSYTLRGKVRLRCTKDILVSQWYDFGGWSSFS